MSQTLGRYSCIKTVGKGGMGEIVLAYDPICDRNIAIKRIRPDLQRHDILKNRFLREAKITSQLTHPGVISIYSIHQEEEEIYYTMPYVEGKTLRQILRAAHKSAQHPENGKESIPALLQIFKSLCQTIAYAHSKGIIHRDLKPENILVGMYGEVIILDWGLAQVIAEPPQELEEEITHSDPGLTSPGKLVGTVAYMAPERALGAPATVQTDLYALGVILYQILTLHLPFNRPSLKEFCKTYKHEKLLDPEEVAPYREVPPRLSRMVKKCLDVNPAVRYQTMDELIHDLLSHLEGRSEWFESAQLDIKKKKHWEFQENVLISKHIAITRTTEAADWVSIMVSKGAFAENTRLHTRVRIGESGEGIGFLLCVPEAADRENPLEGYCLWIGSDLNPACQLFRNTIEVMHFPDLCLKRGEWYSITLEKVDHNIHVILNDQHQFTYLSYLPLFGTHIGVIARDDDFQTDPITISSGSQNLQVSCLSIPDAFLASRDYKRALAEYRRIGYSFPGHAEGREALFRAGITLLEKARTSRTQRKTEETYTQALEEFAKLHNTPGAPLEYLGKALVYQSLRDNAEEIKCLELGLRRYKKHPLVDAIREQIVYRMHEASQTDRRSAYQLILIALRLLPKVVENGDSNRLFKHLTSHWEPLPFLESPIDPTCLGKEKSSEIRFAIPLAFWLGAPYILYEIFQELTKIKPLDIVALGDLLFALCELGSYGLAHKLMQEAESLKGDLSLEEGVDLKEMLSMLEPIWICHQQSLQEAIKAFFAHSFEDMGVRALRTLSYLLQFALRNDQEEVVFEAAENLKALPLGREDQIALDSYQIWAYLKEEKWTQAEELFDHYPMELLNQEGTLLHPLYGCYLYATEGEEIASIHFAGVIDTPFPRSWALLGHELTNKITESVAWYSTSFLWERRQLFRQMTLFYQCSENSDLEAYYRHLEREEYIYAPE
ncbi:MAG: Serine/threonine-protein kinase PknD [Chlamydiales bacterium]|nr:Serine/threonine-protein kinase PknD [Chlamydiales bacterium]